MSIINAPGPTTGNLSSIWGDFGMDVIPAGPCSNPAIAGTASSSVPGICAGNNFTLSLTGYTNGTGSAVQWQTSASGAPGTFTNIPGATSSFLNTSQTATNYYRAEVVCSGGTPAYSNAVQVTNFPPLAAGVYSIDATDPAADYQSLAEAVAALSCGIAGQVTFNVVAGSGPYNEQLTIPQIAGASATSRVIFNGNGETISHSATASTAADRYTVRLDGADYITIHNFNISASGTTYGWGVNLANDADFNEITNNTISVASTSTTASNSAGIVASGSYTAITTDGEADDNLISGNTTNGGYVGIILTGDGTTNRSANNQVINNTILDFYANGIDLEHQSNALVSGNDISRPARNATTTFAGITLSGNSLGSLIEKNRIHNTHDAVTSTSASYGIYFTANDATAAAPNRVINNLIYNFNSEGIIYGIYNSSSDFAQYFHNTVSLDHTSSNGTAVTRGFYQTTAADDIIIKNNIFTLSRGGSGVKTGLFFNTATSTITSDDNIVYVTGGSGTNQFGSLGTTGYATLADWQTGSGHDASSLEADPLYANAAGGSFIPTNALINNSVAPVGVTTDINGAARSASAPDPGAYEFTVPPCVGNPVAGTATGPAADV
ncbi:MAG: hypothetical protein EOP51_27130, partial [Sphingobacteriales bacterium]